MKLISGDLIRKLTIKNNYIVIPKVLYESIVPQTVKNRYECRLLQFVSNGTSTLAVCETLHDTWRDNRVFYGEWKKGDVVSFKIEHIKILNDEDKNIVEED